MKLLVIGGSQFLGRHLVETAAARGDAVTVFNRGQTPVSLPAGVEVRHGDRQSDLSALSGGEWDAVVDCCGYLPRDAARMAECLHGRVGRYVFISSISVYASHAAANDEASAVACIDDPDTEVIDGRTYGALKALCEQAVVARMGAERSLLIRPGLIVGPHDPTQRFTYWPARVARAAVGEAVLAPGPPDSAIQFIDVRDLAQWALHAIDHDCRGIFNATSAPGLHCMDTLLDTCAQVAGSRPDFRWATPRQIEACGLQPWSDLPVWLPPQGEDAGMAQTASARAQAAGLRYRPLAQTLAATLAWYRSLPLDQRAFTKAGLSPEREAAALAQLSAERSGT